MASEKYTYTRITRKDLARIKAYKDAHEETIGFKITAGEVIAKGLDLLTRKPTGGR
jgi:hypothetical protein